MTFPRISISGALILTTFVIILKLSFDNSLYGDSLQSGEMLSSSMLLNSCMMATSLINVISHSAVVLGALNDTYVLSILLGVGFDVTTRVLQLIWWIHISVISFQGYYDSSTNEGGRLLDRYDHYLFHKTIAFLSILIIIYVYHMVVHVKALHMNSSYERLKTVLISALCNLRGIPGKYFVDHLFAYSDLGSHLLPLILSTVLLQKQGALIMAFRIFAVLILLSFFILSRVPLNEMKDCSKEKMICVDESGMITCVCDSCKRRQTKDKDQKISFTFNVNDGICSLWLCSFEELCHLLSLSKSKTKQ